MDPNIEEVRSLVSQLNDKTIQKFHVQTLLNLMVKIKDKEHEEINQMLIDVIATLQGVTDRATFKKNFYFKQYNLLKKTVKTEYGYIAKGDIIAETMTLGIGIGVAIGAGLMTINSAFMGIGISIGVAAGLSVGATREKKEEEKGNIY